MQNSGNPESQERKDPGNHDHSHIVDLRHCLPLLKWAGGKGQILSEFDSMGPSELNRYFEPFVGSGALFFHLISNRNLRLDGTHR